MIAASSSPISANELRDCVRQCRPFDASGLNRILRLDSLHALLEVQAGTRWRVVAEHLRLGGERAQEMLPAQATVGASISWNTAGPDGRPTVTHVHSLTMVTPDGQLRRVDRLTSGGLFALTLGGQGLFGALYSVTLRVESLVRSLHEAERGETLVPSRAEAQARRLRVLVPPQALGAFVAEARARCGEWHTRIEGLQVRRTRQEDETFLRWAQREYAEVTLWLSERPSIGAAVRSTQLRRELIDEAIARGGAFPIACTPEATRAQTAACYPRLASFLAEQRKIDPGGAMENAWLRHQRRLWGHEPVPGALGSQAAV